MSSERRNETRWPAAAFLRLTAANGAQADSRLLNVNLGGCFLEGSFGMQVGEVIYLQSPYQPYLNGVYAQIVWLVNEPTLSGIGVSFQPMDDNQKFELIRWFNKLVPQRPG